MKRKRGAIISNCPKTGTSVTLWPQGVIPHDIYPCTDNACVASPPPPPPPWVLLGASCRQNWSEGQKDFSWLVRWGRFWVQPQGCNTLREKRMGLGLLGAGTQPADGARRLPWIWASQQAKADRAPEPLLLAAGFCHAPEPSPGTQQHETSSKCTTL